MEDLLLSCYSIIIKDWQHAYSDIMYNPRYGMSSSLRAHFLLLDETSFVCQSTQTVPAATLAS